MDGAVRRTARGHTAKRIGSYLRNLRHQSGWTQYQTAEALDVDAVTVRRWELGIYTPSQKNLERLADVYGLDPDDLIREAFSATHVNGNVSVKGYLGVVNHLESLPPIPRDVTVPSFVLDQHEAAFYLIVIGNCLTRDGVHQGDLVVVDPDLPVKIGNLYVVRIGEDLRGGVPVSDEEMAIRTPSGSSELLNTSRFELVGGIVWHMRKI